MSVRVALVLSAGTFALAVSLSPVGLDPNPLHVKTKNHANVRRRPEHIGAQITGTGV